MFFKCVFFSSDLSPLSSLQYMLILDVSHNKLTRLLDFTPPKNLKEANFGYNEIEEMADLSAYHYLTVLNLDRILYTLNTLYKITMSYQISYFQILFYVKHVSGKRNLGCKIQVNQIAFVLNHTFQTIKFPKSLAWRNALVYRISVWHTTKSRGYTAWRICRYRASTWLVGLCIQKTRKIIQLKHVYQMIQDQFRDIYCIIILFTVSQSHQKDRKLGNTSFVEGK